MQAPEEKESIQANTGGMKAQEVQKQNKFEIKTPKGTRDYLPDQMAVRRQVIDTIARVFKKHGAVELDTPVFELKNVLTGKYGEDSKLIYDLKDQGGEQCSLRYDLTVPFARFMASNTNISKIKRFHIGKVYRRDQPAMTKGRLREFYQCDFDIAGNYESQIPDAEVLYIMQEILEELGIHDFVVKVNHRKILGAMITEAGCPPELFKTICSSIDKLDKIKWEGVRAQLISKKCTPEQVQIIARFLHPHIKGEAYDVIEELSRGTFFKKTEKVDDIFKEMKTIFDYLKAMNKVKKVSFDLSLARGLDYYTGMIFQIALLSQTGKEVGSISGGGRYDDLIGMFCHHQIPAVGGSIGIQRIFTILEDKYKAESKFRPNQCEVLVATAGNVDPAKKMKVLSELWSQNIKAETIYADQAKPDKQISHAFEHGIPLILWLGEKELQHDRIKLKVLYKYEEVEITASHLKEDIEPFIHALREDTEKGLVDLKSLKKKQK